MRKSNNYLTCSSTNFLWVNKKDIIHSYKQDLERLIEAKPKEIFEIKSDLEQIVRLEDELYEDFNLKDSKDLVKSFENSKTRQFEELIKLFWKYGDASSYSKNSFHINLFLDILSKNKTKGVKYTDSVLDYSYFKSKIDWILLSSNDSRKNDDSVVKIRNKAEENDNLLLENSINNIYSDIESYITQSKNKSRDASNSNIVGEINYNSFYNDYVINQMNEAIKRRLFESTNNLVTVVIINNKRSNALLESLHDENSATAF